MDATLIVRQALLGLQEKGTTLPEGVFTADFTIHCNGKEMDMAAWRAKIVCRKVWVGSGAGRRLPAARRPPPAARAAELEIL